MRAKIAVASNDGVSISQHFMRTDRFTIFEISCNQIVAEEDAHRHSVRADSDATAMTPKARPALWPTMARSSH